MEKKESKQQEHFKKGLKGFATAVATFAIAVIGKKMYDTNKPNA